MLQPAKAKKRSKKRKSAQAAKVGGGGAGGRKGKTHKHDPLKSLPTEVLINVRPLSQRLGRPARR